jgi:MFS family permease
LTGLVGGLVTLFLARFLLGFGEGATFPTATRAMQNWIPSGKRGFAQGLTHSFARLGGAVTPPIVAALMFAVTWRGAFVILGIVSLIWGVIWVAYFRNEPTDHPRISEQELQTLPARATGPKPKAPWGALMRRLWPVTLTYFCYGWALWLYLNWLPLFFKSNYSLDINHSALFASGAFFAGVVGDTLGGVFSDLLLRRTHNVRFARLTIVLLGFLGTLVSLVPILFFHDITIVALCLSSGFFFAELCIGPMWSIPMDIAPKHAGTASGIMNMGSAFAAIVSPIAAGVMIDMTHNWYLPFIVSIFVMFLGAVCAFLMHPERPLEPGEPALPLGHAVSAT